MSRYASAVSPLIPTISDFHYNMRVPSRELRLTVQGTRIREADSFPRDESVTKAARFCWTKKSNLAFNLEIKKFIHR